MPDVTPSPTQRTYRVWEPVLLAICTAIGLIAGMSIHRPGEVKRSPASSDKGRELNEIVRFIEEKYVDDVNSEALVSGAIEALLKDLDPHSGYLSPEEVRELGERMEGHFEGIGIEFQRVLDTAVILHVIPGGPADNAGLRTYDRIITANDSSMITPGMTESDMVGFLRGEKASVVKLQIARRAVDTLIPVDIRRDLIPIHSIESAYLIQEGVGYIRIGNFNAKTYKEFMDHVEELTQKEGVRDLVIDLRQNPGGYLKEAVNILSQLFDEKGLLLVYTEGEHAARTEYQSTGKPFYPIRHVAVLVDEGSASASEIIAGALQDHDRAVIIGTRTFGKGLVQEQYALSNGGALRLTIARYYTPSGRLIQRPYESGESVAEHGQAAGDSTSYYTTNGRVVNAAGGIKPDIQVDWDFDWHDKRIYQLYADVLEYALMAFQDTVRYTSVEDLRVRFPGQEEVVRRINAYFSGSGRARHQDYDPVHVEAHGDYARMMLMAMIASDQFGHDAWYAVMNAEDPVVQQALEVIAEDPKITLKLE